MGFVFACGLSAKNPWILVYIEAIQRVQKAVKLSFFLHKNEIRTFLQSLKLNQSDLKCVRPPDILACINIS